MIEVQTFQSVEAAAAKNDRPALFACLAAAKAAVRARAAETLLKLYAGDKRLRGGLGRDFGGERDAVTMPLFAEFSAAIGWQPSPGWPKFLASLNIGMEEWREGIGYNIEAFGEMNEEERSMIRQWLRSRLTDGNHDIDWRELEAAAALDDTELLRKLTRHEDSDVRFRVQQHLGNNKETEKELIRILRDTEDLGELSRAQDTVDEFPSEKVKDALIYRLRKNDEYFVPVAMTMLEVYTDIEDSWDERPFLFRVKEEGVDGPLMKELLAKVGR